MKTKKPVLLLLLLTFVMVMTACGGGASSAPPAASTAAAATSAAAAPSAAAPSQSAEPAEPAGEKPVITLTSMYFSAESPENADISAALTDITGYEVNINWIPTTAFDDKLNTLLASDSLTMITTITNLKSTGYLNAVDDGLFWQLDDYIAGYSNIMKMGDARFNNVRRNGKIYGVPRGRDLVRQGTIYRQDWAEEMGMTDQPKTFADLDNMIRTFAERPEASFGVVMGCAGTNPGIPEGVSTLGIYFGAPHEWGYDKQGNFTQAWMTDEFFQAVEQFRVWYADGLVNKNFIEITTEDARKLINTEEAGFIFCYCDDIANRFADLNIKNPDARLWYSYETDGITFATNGFNGTLSVSTSAAKGEDMLGHCLSFIDGLGSPEWQTVIGSGLEGVHYAVQDGFAVQDEAQNVAYSATGAQYGQINCFGGVVNPSIPVKTIPAIEAMKVERLKYVDTCVVNAVVPFVSETSTKIGVTELDPVRCDAINKYIMGQITKEEYEAAQQRWLDIGGQTVIDEFRAQVEAK